MSWSTADGTATAGSDYVADHGIVRFSGDSGIGIPERRPGDPTVEITLLDDAVVETDETFFVRLYGSTAEPGVLLGEAVGVIQNDDAPSPVLLRISDASVTVSPSANAELVFTVSLLGAPASPVSVSWSTMAGGTATPGSDYLAASGTLSFPPGTTSTTIQVTVIGDRDRADETLFVGLASPEGATILDGLGIGTIHPSSGGVHTAAPSGP